MANECVKQAINDVMIGSQKAIQQRQKPERYGHVSTRNSNCEKLYCWSFPELTAR